MVGAREQTDERKADERNAAIMTSPFEPLSFMRGPAMPNRFGLAPLTNQQSHADGTLSNEEITWLEMRARGGFGMVMTAAAFVQQEGKAFEGQLGIHDDICLPGLSTLAKKIRAHGSIATVQLYHGGIRAETRLSGVPNVGPSDDEETGARGMSAGEIDEMIEAFIRGAERAEQAGFHGVEIHGAHGYLLCAFLDVARNRRSDDYGGSLDNRASPIRKIIAGIRARCGADFQLGLRLSAEHFGQPLGEARLLAQQLLHEGQLDWLDMSLWDIFKEPVEEEFKSRPLISWFTDLERGQTRLGVAGKIHNAASMQACLNAGADFPLLGRAAILNHDFPQRVQQIPDYVLPDLPVPAELLEGQGISPAFMRYLGSFPGFLQNKAAA